ncbi:uncharacterized protein VTP21DRAFT_5224 [Calcarisporiella thermophila]|uniref:uncharacterized protein n=1 Tax=Calcarisporiella thermophila TaxID=911321 RepID=UPI003743FCFF
MVISSRFHSIDPVKFAKLGAFICAFLFTFGSHYAGHTLAPLKADLKASLNITNAQYGVLQSSVSLVNSFIPLFGGIFVDSFGTGTGSLVSSFLIVVGQSIVSVGVQKGTYGVVIAGRVLFGVGSGTVVIAQESILGKWFRGKGLTLALASLFSISRLASFLANVVAVPIKNATGFYGNAFWVATGVCIFCFFVNIVFVYFANRAEHHSTVASSTPNVNYLRFLKRNRTFHLRRVLYLPLSYWLIVFLQMLLAGLWTSFLHVGTELVQIRFGEAQAIAAFNAGIGQTVPIVVSPFWGALVDRFGRRVCTIFLSSIILVVSQCILGFLEVTPIVGIVLFSVSLTLGPIGLVSSIPLLLQPDLIGTGYGIFKVSDNIGSTLFDIGIGYIQDATPGRGYGGVIVFFLLIASISTLASVLLWIVDWRLGEGILEAGHKKRTILLDKWQADRQETEQSVEKAGNREQSMEKQRKVTNEEMAQQDVMPHERKTVCMAMCKAPRTEPATSEALYHNYFFGAVILVLIIASFCLYFVAIARNVMQ